MSRRYGSQESQFNQYVSKFAHTLRFSGIGLLLVALVVFGLMDIPKYINLSSDIAFVLMSFGIGLELFFHILEGELWA